MEHENESFDLRGQICPSTLLTALKKVNERKAQLKEGLILEFKVDNRDAINTIPESATRMGYRFDVEKSYGFYKIKIYK
ncbi:MAG: sulfurtransferase TusA family protein [Flexistipes sinusarabici]|uniref:Sulfurtransferase TusA family protein n=1 Tax=Flexistipes sinusarabici TaxID=2352 RepID=A0A5D0MPY3_FLESI|nr:sulfurtransferase TusA family protein [Flexistipes sinusarabici]TYB33630.1 MAG: sulfurtransferase TusA family protein [Flexistipes sinusarabici]